MRNKLIIASLALSGLVSAQCGEVGDSITISKNTLKEIYVFLDGSIEWIEEEQMNQVCLDEDCRWMWKLRDELPLNLSYPFDE